MDGASLKQKAKRAMDEFDELLSWIEDPKNGAVPAGGNLGRTSKAAQMDEFDRMFEQIKNVRPSQNEQSKDARLSTLFEEFSYMEVKPKSSPKAAGNSNSSQSRPTQRFVISHRAFMFLF
jgi:hypothetical protein